MPISFACSGCGKKFKVPDTAAGKKSKCPQCQQSIQVPFPIAAAPVATAVPVKIETMDCPFCTAEIPSAALKCKHCGETVNAAMRAAEEAKRTVSKPRRRDRDDDYDDDYDDRPRRRRDRDDRSVQQHVNVVVGDRRAFPHLFHFILTVLTCGLWFPIWVIAWLFGR